MFQQVISQITWHGKGDYLASVVPQGKRLTLNYFEEDLPQKRYAFCVVYVFPLSWGLFLLLESRYVLLKQYSNFLLYLLGGNKSVFIHHIPKRRSQVREASDQLLSGWKIYISPVVSINSSMSDCRRCNARAVTGRGREAKPVSLLAAKQTTGLTGLTNQWLSIYYCLAVGRTFLFITSKAPLIELIFSSYFSVPSRNPKV